MLTCDTCGTEYVRQDDLQPEDECDECASYRYRYESMTPDERRDEDRMIADYVAESDEL